MSAALGAAVGDETRSGMGLRRRHPALDGDDHEVTLARVADGEVQIITSRRQAYAAADYTDLLTTKPRPYPDLAGRWDGADVVGFLGGEPAPSFADVAALVIHAIDRAMEFPCREHRALVATWALSTYFHPVFLAYPRLSVSGEREAGKSKLLALLHATCWNALLMLAPTPAVLFRLVQEWRPTLLLDEMEGLAREDKHEVLGIINAGYKAGATVPRCEGDKQKRVESYAVYAPIALAAIRSPNATTEDRCIPLVLQRGADRAKLNAEVDPREELYARIRAGCHRLLLTRWRDVMHEYRTVALPGWLNARARELWKPLLAVGSLADRDGGLTLTPDLLVLARDHVQERPGITAESEALLGVLTERLAGEGSVIVRPGELRDPVRLRLGWRDAPSAEAVSGWLRRLGMRRLQKDRGGARYEVTSERVCDVTVRYGGESTITPPPSPANLAISGPV